MDLSILIEENNQRDTKSTINDKIIRAKRLGFHTIALDVRIAENSIPNNIPKPPEIPKTDIRIKTRLTARLTNSLHIHKLSRAKAQLEYDLLALETSDDKMLAQLCSGQIDCDIVCLDLTSSRLHQILRKANLNLPRERGIVFELKLYDLLSSQSSRINAISNGRLLVDKCKAKNLIFSSAARHYLDLRSPADTVNLCALYAIPSHLRKATVYQTAERALKHSQIRKMPVKNAIEILDNADQWIQNALSD